MIRIGHGNGHNEASLVQYVRDADADSFGCNESQRLFKALDELPGSRVIAPDREGLRDARAASSCIVTANKRKDLGRLVRQVSERIPRFERIAPDRTLIGSFFAHPLAERLGFEGVAHFNLHPDAGPKALNGHDARHPLVREYAEALTSTAIHMQAARRDGLLVVLTGDLQVRADHTRPWGPRKMLAEKMGLDFWVTDIDWIMFDRHLDLAGPPVTRRLHDHTGFVARLQAREG